MDCWCVKNGNLEGKSDGDKTTEHPMSVFSVVEENAAL